MIRSLHREQILHRPLAEVWDFFATPRNLNEITPAEMSFVVLGDVAARMYAGQMIQYRIGVLPGIRIRWLTEITHVREGEYFVDEQRVGPYRIWHHEHFFQPTPDGRAVTMTDHVTYEVGRGPMGELLHAVWIGHQLAAIFDYRARCIAERFGPAPTAGRAG